MSEGADTDIVAFLGALMDVQRLLSTLIMPLARQYAVSERAVGIVFLVHAGLNRPGLLHEYLHVLPSTITSDVDKLIAADLLRRTTSDTDRRLTLIEVTPKGAEMQQKSVHLVRQSFRQDVSGVEPDELQDCVALLRRLGGARTPDGER